MSKASPLAQEIKPHSLEWLKRASFYDHGFLEVGVVLSQKVLWTFSGESHGILFIVALL